MKRIINFIGMFIILAASLTCFSTIQATAARNGPATTVPTSAASAFYTAQAVTYNSTQTKIAFVSNREGIDEIFTMSGNGTGVIRVTNTDFANMNPALSPDGNQIVFESFRNGPAPEIYIMNSDGTNQVRLTNNTFYDNYPVWSPDGSKVVFDSNREGNNNIYIMNKDGTNPVRLTDSQFSDQEPACWSPDGTRMAFASVAISGGQIDGNEIYTMNLDGSDRVRLTNNSSRDFQPAWSPDGTRIAFTSWRGPETGIYLMNQDGSNQILLAPGANPAWSPDGSRIAFTSWIGGNAQIMSMKADGTDPVRLVDNLSQNWCSSWSVVNGVAPSIITNNATNLSGNSAQLKGYLSSTGSAQDAYVLFQWGQDQNSFSNETAPGKVGGAGGFDMSLGGLSPGTTYYYRAKAFRQGTTCAGVVGFTTTGSTQNCSIALISSANPSAWGQPLTFTANVTAVPPASGTPSGNITFKDGTFTMGTGALNATGMATYSTSALSAGSHDISAEYGGDANFAAGTPAILNQIIWKHGDADGDGKVDIGDVTKVERIILGYDSATPGVDANNDGLNNVGDVTKIERIILGLDQ